jgi:hypothetical protein
MLDIAISLDEKIRGTSVKDYWRALVEKVSSDIRRASEDFDIEVRTNSWKRYMVFYRIIFDRISMFGYKVGKILR